MSPRAQPNNKIILKQVNKFAKKFETILICFFIYIPLLANDSNSEFCPHQSRIFASLATQDQKYI